MEHAQARLDGELALAAIEAAADMVLVLAADGRVHYANAEACRALGYGAGEITALRLADIDPFFAPPERWEQLWSRISADSEVRVRETRHRRRDGRLLPVEVRARYAEVGGRHYVFSFARDISERLRGESELRRSEALYRRLLDELPVSVIHNTPDGRILFLNEHGRRIIGYGQDELEGIRTADLYVNAADRERLVRHIESGGEYRFEVPMRHKDGRTVWVRGRSRQLHDVDGRVYYQGVAEDVTAERRQKAEEGALADLRRAVWGMKREEDIEDLVSQVRLTLEKLDVPVQGCAIHIVDDPSQPLQVQTLRSEPSRTEWSRSLNRESEGIVLDLWRRGDPVYRPDLRTEDAAGELGNIEQKYTHPVRSVVDVPYSHGTLAVNNEAPGAFLPEHIEAMVRVAEVLSEGFRRLDDLRRLARRAQEGESLARAIQLVAASDRPGDIFAAVVSEAAALTGCERASLFIYDPEEGALVPRAQLGHGPQYMDIRLQKGEDMSGTVFERGEPMVLGADNLGAVEQSRLPGTEALFKSLVPNATGVGAAVPLLLDGEPIGTLSVGSGRRRFGPNDVEMLQRLGEQAVLALDRARRTEDLEERNRELEERVAESRRLEAQLRQAQKMEAIGQLTAGVAHNFNNILQIIKANLYLASDSGGGGEQLDEADAAVERAAEMIRRLLVFSRRERLDTQKVVDLGQTLGYVSEICRKTFDRRIEIDIARPEERLAVRGDRGLLEQVFLNLCLNARDALDERGPRGPRIGLRLLSRAGEARVEVEDNGCGMDRPTRERAFDPFFTTKEVGQGTGLGLSTVYGIMAQHGGRITCESEPGRGTLFAVELPLVSAEVESETAGPPLPSPSPATGRTVLLVDDEEQVRLSTARMLERGGYRVLTAVDGLEGVAVFEKAADSIDVVLLDLSMPRLSGRETLQELRRIRPGVKVVICTGYGARYEEVGPVEAVLTKPYMRDELLLQLEKVLEA